MVLEDYLDLLRCERVALANKEWKRLRSYRDQEPFFMNRLATLNKVLSARQKDLAYLVTESFEAVMRPLDQERCTLFDQLAADLAFLHRGISQWQRQIAGERAALKSTSRFRRSAYSDPQPSRLDISG